MRDPPKYNIGTLLLSNLPYFHGRRREREIGWIIHIYEKAIPFTKVSIWMYVVEWNSIERRGPVTYTVEDIDCFVKNLRDATK